MSDKEIRIASESLGIMLGSHGFLHNNLANILLPDATDELLKSKNYLENLIQKPVNSLAYPDGSYSRELIDEAYKIGFWFQLEPMIIYFRKINRIKELKKDTVFILHIPQGIFCMN